MDTSTPNSTFLSYAKWKPLAEVKAVLAAEVNIHATESDGDNAVHLAACWNDDRSVVRFLLDLGIDAHVGGSGGIYPLHGFAAKGDLDLVVRMLDEGDPVDLRARDGRTPLHFAAAGGNRGVVVELLRRGADVDARNHSGRTPLHYASTIEAIDALAQAGADLDAQSKWGDTALHESAFWCHADRCQKLIDLGANLEARANDGATALLRSVKNPDRKGQVGATMVLISAGADLAAKDNRNSTIQSLAKTRPELRHLLASSKAHQVILDVAGGFAGQRKSVV